MIVTVCYGPVRVVVPCGDGSLKVDELKELANERYNKAIGRPRESPVPVHHLQTQSGILDPDDELATVVSDKEQIFICFDDDPRVPQGGGDGASGSSAGTGSPDIFRGSDAAETANASSGKYPLASQTPNAQDCSVHVQKRVDLVTTGGGGSSSSTDVASVTVLGAGGTAPLSGGSGGLSMLQVRRSSDPSLNVTAAASPSGGSSAGGSNPMANTMNGMSGSHPHYQQHHPHQHDPMNRWSFAAVCRSDQSSHQADGHQQQQLQQQQRHPHLSPSWEDELEMDGTLPAADHQPLHHPHHIADASVSSSSTPLLLSPNDSGGQFSRSGRLSMQFLGAEAAVSGYKWIDAAERAAHSYQNSKSLPRDGAKRKEPIGQAYESIREAKTDEMLLIHSEAGAPLGLTAVPDGENGGLLVQQVAPGGAAEAGRLRAGDRILEINGRRLLVGQCEQTVQSMLRQGGTLRIRVIRATKTTTAAAAAAARQRLADGGAKSAHVSPTKKGQQQQQQQPPAHTGGNFALQASNNTRKIGRKYEIALRKGVHGLGFSVTTRDNPAGGLSPICIKKILPLGAAIVDGRLKAGDRLLEVNGVSMTGRTQADVVEILRSTPPNAIVKFVVSRQQEVTGSSASAAAVLDVAVEEETAQAAERRDQVSEPDSVTPPKPPAPIFPTLKPTLKQPAAVGVQQRASPSGRPGVDHNELTEQNLRRHFIEAATTTCSSETIVSALSGNSIGSLASSTAAAASAASAGGSTGPRQREILTLHIPVHDTEKAGLGVSVKGKTGSNNSSTGSNGSNSSSSGGGHAASRSAAQADGGGDLGIFVKSVLNGGAASLDGRLRMNDQLLYVNEISLLDQSNEEAMETLRKAMLQRSSTHPGTITLTVSRRIGSRPNSQLLQHQQQQQQQHASVSSSFDISHTRSVSSTSEQSGKTVIYLSAEKLEEPATMKTSAATGEGSGSKAGTLNSRAWTNPVLERLTGGTVTSMAAPCAAGPPPSKHQPAASVVQLQQQQQQQREFALRNESYYMATKEMWSPNQADDGGVGSMMGDQRVINTSVLIEEDPEPPSPTAPLSRRHPKPLDTTSLSSNLSHNNNTTTTAEPHPYNTSVASSSSAAGARPGGGNGDVTYDSQLSLDTNPDAFSRDAVGRRSMSEKHHAALDAKETGTYQRNKRAREQRDHERRVAHFRKSTANGGSSGSGLPYHLAHAQQQQQRGSMESLQSPAGSAAAAAAAMSAATAAAARDEALDRVGDLGPSLGLKKSSSLESLQTMVQEIQLSDEPSRGPLALRTPRGRGREDALRAAVESRGPEANKPRKHWLLDVDGGSGAPSDSEGGFISRHGPFQGSLNEGKAKAAAAAAAAATIAARPHKKPTGLLKGIGHMFRFGRHRKDSIAPLVAETRSDLGPMLQQQRRLPVTPATTTTTTTIYEQGQQGIYQTRAAAMLPSGPSATAAATAAASNAQPRPPGGPPNYQPPPPVSANGLATDATFNQRYAQSLYVNHGELQQQMGSPASPPVVSSPSAPASPADSDVLSESTIAQMRQQVMQQRVKVEEESRRNQHYHSQRSVSSRKIDYHMAGPAPQLPHAMLAQLHVHHQQQQQQPQQRPPPHHLHQSPPQQHPVAGGAHLPVGRPYQQQHEQQPQQQQQQPPHLHHYHQQHHHQRPVSSYYGEYETVNKYDAVPVLAIAGAGVGRKTSAPTSPLKHNSSLGSSGRYQRHQQLEDL